MLGWFRKKKKTDLPATGAADDPSASLLQDESPDIEPVADRTPPSKTETSADTEAQSLTESAPEVEGIPASEPEPTTVSAAAEENPVQDKPKPAPSVFKRLSQRLSRTRESFTMRIDELFLGKKQIDAALFDQLEEILVTADLGISTTMELLETARRRVKRDSLSDPQQLKEIIKAEIKSYIQTTDRPAELSLPDQGPFVIMVVGVNGVGKTTTIGKIACKFIATGRSVLLVAADTFRAAAISQLKVWGERNGARVIAQHEGADPSSVVFDAMAVARSKDYDVVLIDTAGRLHTRANLMDELKKIKRVIGKQLDGAPHEVLLVVDATTGQNGISQATLFNEAVGVTGIALTKLDGTAKGGIVANIVRELGLPIRFIGVGEQIEDLRDFDADEFIEALFSTKEDDHPSSGKTPL